MDATEKTSHSQSDAPLDKPISSQGESFPPNKPADKAPSTDTTSQAVTQCNAEIDANLQKNEANQKSQTSSRPLSSNDETRPSYPKKLASQGNQNTRASNVSSDNASNHSDDSGHFGLSPIKEITDKTGNKSAPKRHSEFSIDYLLSHDSSSKQKNSSSREAHAPSQPGYDQFKHEVCQDVGFRVTPIKGDSIRPPNCLESQNDPAKVSLKTADDQQFKGPSVPSHGDINATMKDNEKNLEATPHDKSANDIKNTNGNDSKKIEAIERLEDKRDPLSSQQLSKTIDFQDGPKAELDAPIHEEKSSTAVQSDLEQQLQWDESNSNQSEILGQKVSESQQDYSTPNQNTRVKRKLKRTNYSKEDISLLNSKFNENPWLSPEKQERLAAEMGYTDTQIKTWFQNKRASTFGSRKPKKRALQEIPSNTTSPAPFHAPGHMTSYHGTNQIQDLTQVMVPRDHNSQSQSSFIPPAAGSENVMPGHPPNFTVSFDAQSYHRDNILPYGYHSDYMARMGPYHHLLGTPLASPYYYPTLGQAYLLQNEAFLPQAYTNRNELTKRTSTFDAYMRDRTALLTPSPSPKCSSALDGCDAQISRNPPFQPNMIPPQNINEQFHRHNLPAVDFSRSSLQTRNDDTTPSESPPPRTPHSALRSGMFHRPWITVPETPPHRHSPIGSSPPVETQRPKDSGDSRQAASPCLNRSPFPPHRHLTSPLGPIDLSKHAETPKDETDQTARQMNSFLQEVAKRLQHKLCADGEDTSEEDDYDEFEVVTSTTCSSPVKNDMEDAQLH